MFRQGLQWLLRGSGMASKSTVDSSRSLLLLLVFFAMTATMMNVSWPAGVHTARFVPARKATVNGDLACGVVRRAIQSSHYTSHDSQRLPIGAAPQNLQREPVATDTVEKDHSVGLFVTATIGLLLNNWTPVSKTTEISDTSGHWGTSATNGDENLSTNGAGHHIHSSASPDPRDDVQDVSVGSPLVQFPSISSPAVPPRPVAPEETPDHDSNVDTSSRKLDRGLLGQYVVYSEGDLIEVFARDCDELPAAVQRLAVHCTGTLQPFRKSVDRLMLLKHKAPPDLVTLYLHGSFHEDVSLVLVSNVQIHAVPHHLPPLLHGKLVLDSVHRVNIMGISCSEIIVSNSIGVRIVGTHLPESFFIRLDGDGTVEVDLDTGGGNNVVYAVVANPDAHLTVNGRVRELEQPHDTIQIVDLVSSVRDKSIFDRGSLQLGGFHSNARITLGASLQKLSVWTDSHMQLVESSLIQVEDFTAVANEISVHGVISSKEGLAIDLCARTIIIHSGAMLMAHGGNVRLRGEQLVRVHDGALIDVSSVSNPGGNLHVEAVQVEVSGGVVGSTGLFHAQHCRTYLCGTVHTAVVSPDLVDDDQAAGIRVLGDYVNITDSGVVDVSGSVPGKQVQIGGDFGGRYGLRQAYRTTVSPGAYIGADALIGGDGGRIALWATGLLDMSGFVSARGGALWGHGGFVEISGKTQLLMSGRTDQRSGGNGRSGSLLIDPDNIQVDDTPVHNGYLPIISVTDTSVMGGTFLLSAAGILQNLRQGNVYIEASTNIKIYEPIQSNDDHNNTLTFKAGNTFLLYTNSPISVTGKVVIIAGAGLTLQSSCHADDGLVLNSDSDDSGSGSFEISSGQQVSTINSPIRVIAADVNVAGKIDAGYGAITVSPTHGNKLGLGHVAKDMHLTDAELGRITSSAIQIGSSTAGEMYIVGITDHPAIGSVDLIATHPRGLIEFAAWPAGVSFGAGCNIAAMAGIKIMTNFQSYGQRVILNSGTGTLTVAATKSVLTTNEALTITADDIDLQAGSAVSSGTESTKVQCFSAGRTVGLGSVTRDLSISGVDLQRIVTNGFSVGGGNCGKLTVTGMTPQNSGQVTGLVSLLATRDDAQVEFSGIASTFHVLAVQADNGILVKADLTTISGALYIDGDVENSSSSDGFNAIGFTDGRSMIAKTVLTLESSTGAISQAGALTMKAGAGVVILADQSGFSKGKIVTINADYEIPGDGTLTIVSGKTLTSNDSDMIVTAFDLDLAGGFNTGNSTLTIHASQPLQTIGLGHTARHMWITDAEMSRLAGQGLVIGSSTSGSITVNGAQSSFSLMVTLLATDQYRQVIFETSPSTFDGLTANADDGIVLRTAVTTTTGSMHLDGDVEDNVGLDIVNNVEFFNDITILAKGVMTLEATTGNLLHHGSLTLAAGEGIVLLNNLRGVAGGLPVVLNADYDGGGDGTLTVVATKVVTSNDGDITLTAWDLDMQGILTANTKSLSLHGAVTNQTIGLGTTSANMHVTDAELGRMTAAGGMRVGGSAGGSIIVNGITAASSEKLGTVVSLVAQHNHAEVRFTAITATFNALAVQADSGIRVAGDIVTDTGYLYMDGDVENDRSSDPLNGIAFTNSSTIRSKALLTLESTTGEFVIASSFSLEAGTGIVLLDHMQGETSGTQLVINADYESAGDGTLTIFNGKTLHTNDSQMLITAWDLDLAGSMVLGIADVFIHGSKTGQTVGIGYTFKNLHISDAEVNRISANGVTIGNAVNGDVIVNGIRSASSNNILSTFSIVAIGDNNDIDFATTASTFNALAAQADNGVLIKVDLTSDAGSMYLDGDFEDSSSSDAKNDVQFTDGLKITAKGVMTLEATTGNLLHHGSLTLAAGEGIVLLNNLRGVAGGLPVVLNADYDGGGDGTLTVVATKVVTSNDGDITLTAWDLDMQGILTANTKSLSLHGAVTNQTIGLGTTSANMHVTDAELGRMTAAGGMRVGGSAGGSIIVNGITAASSESIDSIISLVASHDDSTIKIGNTSSTFNSLSVQADNGITISSNLLTDKGHLYLNGDLDQSAISDPANGLVFEQYITVHSKTVLTLQTNTGLISTHGYLTLNAGSGLLIHADYLCTTNGTLHVLNADHESFGDGTLTISGSKTIDSNNGNIILTAWDLDIGSITASSAMVTIHAAQPDQTIGIGLTAKNMHLTDSEVGRITATQGLTIGGPTNGDITLDGATTGATDSIGILTLTATNHGKRVAFETTPSSFDKGIVVRAQGVVFSESVTARNSVTGVDTGTGTLTVAAGKILSTTQQRLIITTNDFDVQGVITTETSPVQIAVPPGATIGIAAIGETVSIKAEHLTLFDCNGLEIGQHGVNGRIVVGGVTKAESDTIRGTVTLIATRDDAQVIFQGRASTFGNMAVQADNGILVKVDLTTTGGFLYLDGDFENSSSSDGINTIGFTDGTKVVAKTVLTLESTTGYISYAGDVSLFAGTGIQLLDDVFSSSLQRSLVLNADYEMPGDGTLTITVSKAITSNHGSLTVTAWDVDLSGTLYAGTGSVAFHGSMSDQTFGIGATAKDLHITNTMVSRITGYGGFTVGTSDSGSITVDGVQDAATIGLGVVTLRATRPSRLVTFTGTDSFFNQGIVVEGMGGVVLEASLTTKTTTNVLSAGTGTLTIMSGKILSTSNMPLAITVNDLDIQGQGMIDVFNSTLSIASQYEGRTFGLGDITKDLNINDDEMGQLRAFRGLTIGDSKSGSISISGLTDSSTDDIGQLTLVATKAERLITFENLPSTFNKGMTIQASRGVRYFESVETKMADVVIYAGTGTLTVANTKSLKTNDRKLTITADDIDIKGSLTTGTAPLDMACVTAGRVVGFGLKKQFSYDNAELQRTTANGLYLGGDMCGEFWVHGIGNDGSQNVAGIITLAAVRDDAWILFRGVSSTFNMLSAQADNGILVNRHLSTTGGMLYLDGDYENSSSGDAINTIGFTDGRIVRAKTLLTLEATKGRIEPTGALTLNAGTGIVLLDSMRSITPGRTVTLNSDDETAGDGTLTIVATKVVSTNNSDMIITAWDLNLQGLITCGTKELSIHGASTSQSIGIGVTPQELTIDTAELSQIAANGGTTVGSSTSGDILVSGVTQSTSATIGILTLIATKASRKVVFEHYNSAFNKGIIVQAMAGIAMNKTVETMASPSTLYAGTGTLTLAAGETLSTTNQGLSVTADDIDWKELAVVNVGAAALIIHATTLSQTIGLGLTSKDMHITDAELGCAEAAGGLIIGNSRNGDIVISGITDSSSDTLGVLTLIARQATRTVKFSNTASSFNKGIIIQTAGGVVLSETVTTKNSNIIISAGTGTLTVIASKELLSTGQKLTVTTDDMDLAGNVNTGSAATIVHCNTPGLTVGLGIHNKDLTISGTELEHLTSTGFTIGDTNCGLITAGILSHALIEMMAALTMTLILTLMMVANPQLP